MKRSGFTMIELIFVIVILGILAAVALPKFIGVSEQANVGKLKGYVGTLNRTVGPALWSQSIASGSLGDVSAPNDMSLILLQQIETPQGIGDTTALDLTDPALANCAAVGNFSLDTTAVGAGVVPALTAANAMSTVTVGGQQYLLGCENGDANTAPRFFLQDPNGNLAVK